MGDLLGSSHHSDLINSPNLGAQPSVNAKNLAIDNGGEDEKVKHVTAGLPDRGVAVLLLALLVKSVDLGNLSRFVVTADQDYSVWIPVEDVSSET